MQAFGHAEPGSQNADDRGLAPGQDRCLHGRERRLDGLGSHRDLAGHFVAHELGDFPQQLSERSRLGFALSHQCQLVLDQRVIEDVQVAE